MVFSPIMIYVCSVLEWQATIGIFSVCGPVAIVCSCLMKPLTVDIEEVQNINSTIEVQHTFSSTAIDQVQDPPSIKHLQRRKSFFPEGFPVAHSPDLRRQSMLPPLRIKRSNSVVPSLAIKPPEVRRYSANPVMFKQIAYNNSWFANPTPALEAIPEAPTHRDPIFTFNISPSLKRLDEVSNAEVSICSDDSLDETITWLKTIQAVFKEMLDFRCLNDKRFRLVLLSNFIACLAHQTVFIYLPSIIVSESLLTEETASLVIALIGVSNIFGRVSGGIITNLRILAAIFVTLLSFLGSGTCVLAFKFCSQKVTYMITGIFYGFAAGPYLSVTPTMLIDLFELQQLTSTFGLLTFARAIAICVGPPVLGVLYTLTDQYSTVLSISSAFFGIGAFLCAVVCIYAKTFKTCKRKPG